jgi:hypothetical protein
MRSVLRGSPFGLAAPGSSGSRRLGPGWPGTRRRGRRPQPGRLGGRCWRRCLRSRRRRRLLSGGGGTWLGRGGGNWLGRGNSGGGRVGDRAGRGIVRGLASGGGADARRGRRRKIRRRQWPRRRRRRRHSFGGPGNDCSRRGRGGDPDRDGGRWRWRRRSWCGRRRSWCGRRGGRRDLGVGFGALGLNGPAQPFLIRPTTDAVGLLLLDARRVALDPDPELKAQVQGFFVGEAELAS